MFRGATPRGPNEHAADGGNLERGPRAEARERLGREEEIEGDGARRGNTDGIHAWCRARDLTGKERNEARE